MASRTLFTQQTSFFKCCKKTNFKVVGVIFFFEFLISSAALPLVPGVGGWVEVLCGDFVTVPWTKLNAKFGEFWPNMVSTISFHCLSNFGWVPKKYANVYV
jgi:hypothetical protein